MTRKETLEHAKAIVDSIFHKKEEHITLKKWIARDKNGSLWLFMHRPWKDEPNRWWVAIGSQYFLEDCFPNVKWEDEEPTEAEITIKIHKK